MKLAPWIRLIAYQERPPSVRPRREIETDADAASRIGHRVVTQLRASIAAEIGSAGNGTNRRAASIDDRQPFGFQVTYTDAATSNRTLTIALVGRTVSCKYCVVNADGVAGAKNQWLTFAADQRALLVWDHGVCRRFDGIERLATFLIAAMARVEGPCRDS